MVHLLARLLATTALVAVLCSDTADAQTCAGNMRRDNNLADLCTASTSRTNLGLGTLAIQDANNISITGGTMSGVSISGVGDIEGVTAGVGLTGGGTSGTVSLALANPSASSLGGVQSYAAVSNQWINAISTSGVPSSAQPAFSNISGTATVAQLPSAANTIAIPFIIDGGGSAITTGVKGVLLIPFACTITAVDVILDQSGSIVVDIWKLAFSTSTLPAVGNTITASAKPTVSATIASTNTTLTGWTTSVSARDVLRYNVDSITTATSALVTVTCVKS